MKNILKLVLLILLSNAVTNSQDVPFGQLTRIRKLQQNTYGDPLGLVTYGTNVFVIPMRGGAALELSDDIFMPSQNFPVTRVQFADNINGVPFIVDGNQIYFNNKKPNWSRVSLVEYITDYQILLGSVYFTGKNPVDNYDYIIKTKDFVSFERLKIKAISDSTPRLFKINNDLIISSQNRLVFDLYKVKDFNAFEKIESKGTNIIDAVQFKDRLISINFNGMGIYSSDLDFANQKPLGFNIPYIYNFLCGSDMIFAYYDGKIFYSNNGDNWQSFIVQPNGVESGFPNQMVIFDNHLLFSGDRFDVYKIGPITSSKPLSVESELIHAVKITGNIGQQVEILASDELNGEYKPLTYFTLPSTEFIYNDNRTNKTKQYYKVR
jgi:hypothetical protein